MDQENDQLTQTTQTLADLRKKVGLSQSALARRMGVNRPRVGQIEQDFPRVRFDVVQNYIQALGGYAALHGIADTSVRADQIDPDPRGPRDHGYRKKSLPAEELPLEQRSTDTGGNDPGRDVDEGDPEGHQGDREDREET